MKKLASIILTSFLLVFSVSSVFAQSTTRAQKVVIVPVGEVVDKDFYIGAGDIVEISGTVNGDVVVAGGQLLVDGVVNGDLLAAGGTISVSGEVAQDVRIVGGQLTISGKVGRNVTAVGGNIEVANSAEIAGGAIFAGGNVIIEAPIGGEVYVGAGSLTISDQIAGDVQAGVGALRLTSNAKIIGDFTYYSDEAPSIDENATISGKLIRKEPPARRPDISEKEISDFGKGLKGSLRFISFITALVFGLLMIRFLPNYTKAVAYTVRDKLVKSLGYGFLALILTPIIVLVLLVTVIGLPLGIILGFSYLLYIYLSKIFIAICIGNYLFDRFKKKKSNYLPFIVGLAVFYLLSLLPYIGGLTRFVVLLLGLGAAVLHCKECYPKALKNKVI